MAEIISFETRSRRLRKGSTEIRRALPGNWSAEIIIFPGVRIERYVEETVVIGAEAGR